jgi:putative ABC transport system permease protein
VFLDEAVTEVALGTDAEARGVMTYFVNELRAGERSTPYSMVTAMGAPVVPSAMGDDEILVNAWLAEDLQLNPGDAVELSYFTMGLGRGLVEAQARFRVHGVIPLSGAAADRELMPEFPGIEQAESTRDWDPSLPVDLSRIRPKDEQYWEEHRGTPKAFITLAAGQKIWANRYGNLTAVRYPADASAPEVSAGFHRAMRCWRELDPRRWVCASSRCANKRWPRRRSRRISAVCFSGSVSFWWWRRCC